LRHPVEAQPRPRYVQRNLAVNRADAVVDRMEHARQIKRVEGDPVWLKVRRGKLNLFAKVQRLAEKRQFGLAEQAQVGVIVAQAAQSRLTEDARAADMRVLNVVDRVVVRLLDRQVEVEVKLRARRAVEQHV